ncbi:alpha/beta hydrolase [Bacillus altitudinis MN12]|uniref:alpha/beta fold hydrolase n=1 Tax=Bacillus TaxID=1386 RepID=UPI000706599A|nr:MULTISPECIES: alpha/beta hydrolase [Bacillus]MCA1016160.1 alpha/beta hydrolase [Bacillus stratosphericus]ALM27051.1 alpha/beta hydrolase [Bacillus altitudinis]ALM47140.1 alpha/beta hydrolase [Bacillus altitudinis]ANY98622.1 alpha/beta hydrolase [Bacillus altitudinis]MBR0584070.1 alpha/beta hydrolase [Bacillus altitudinis MN12]
MKKLLKIMLIALCTILTVLVVFVASVYVVNLISNEREQGKIEAYGQKVLVDGKQMNVLIQGDGKETIVLLPGYGTASPVLDFKPLVKELSPYYRVVVIEPFGYGLSDDTDKVRTSQNIVDEIHECLQKLNIKKYTLMGHSISGIYGLEYVNQYEKEVQAFVGIDTSVPKQETDELPVSSLQLLHQSGFYRLIVKMNPEQLVMPKVDDQTKAQIKMLTFRNFLDESQASEAENFRNNFKNAQRLHFPKKLPVAFYLADQTEKETPNWKPMHEELLKNVDHGKIVTFKGGHYLHHTKSKEIADDVREFLSNNERSR